MLSLMPLILIEVSLAVKGIMPIQSNNGNYEVSEKVLEPQQPFYVSALCYCKSDKIMKEVEGNKQKWVENNIV